MLTDLADLLRLSLRHTAAQEVPLREKLGFLGRYVDIMRVRFGDRLGIAVDAGDDVLDAMVPRLVLQPLVENAIRHGMADRADKGHLAIRAVRDGGAVRLEVSDDGPGLRAIRQWTEERKGDVLLYDIVFTQRGQKLEADINQDGSIHNWEREVAARDVPAAVPEAVQRKYPGATITLILAITAVQGGKEALEGYEVLLVTTERKEVELTVGPDGTVVEATPWRRLSYVGKQTVP